MSIQDHMNTLLRNTTEVIDVKELENLLIKSQKEKRPLRIKLGLDPSTPDLHLGHTLVLRKLRDFQDLGHIAVLVVGDFTARIGDPSGRNKLRPRLTGEEVSQNAKTYTTQAFKILDPDKTEVVHNHTWLSKLSSEDVILLCSEMSVARMLEREDFTQRYKNGIPIFLHEFLYPLYQGFDSVVLKNDVELGGIDQKFNLLVGRDLQRSNNLPPQQLVMMPLLEGLDGVQKMSKSYGNAISLNDPPHDMFGKIMSISDQMMVRYIELFSADPDPLLSGLKKGNLHPMDAKMRVAYEITAQFHSHADAKAAQQQFEDVHRQGGLPSDIPTVTLQEKSLDLATLVYTCGLSPSMKESRRKIMEGAVKINDSKITDPKTLISITPEPQVLKLGKRHFRKFQRHAK